MRVITGFMCTMYEYGLGFVFIDSLFIQVRAIEITHLIKGALAFLYMAKNPSSLNI